MTYISDAQMAQNEIQRKIARRQHLVADLTRISQRLDKIEEELYAPERHTGREYDNLVQERSGLLIEYENKERSLKQEFPFKDIDEEIERITNKNQENEDKI